MGKHSKPEQLDWQDPAFETMRTVEIFRRDDDGHIIMVTFETAHAVLADRLPNSPRNNQWQWQGTR